MCALYAVYVIQNFGSSLARWCWIRVSLDRTVKMLARGAVVWRFDWDFRIHFQGGSLPWQEYWCCLLSGGFRSSLFGPFPEAGWVSWIYGSCLPPEITTDDPRNQDGSCNVFHDIALKVTYHHSCSILFIAQISPIYYEWSWIRASIGSQLETWLPQSLIN